MKNRTFPAKIPGFVVEFSKKEKEEIFQYNQQILKTGRLHLGPLTEIFEDKFAAMVGTKFAIAVNSGSTALEVIFRSIGVSGRSVLVPSNTNFATAISALNAGANVRLYDSGLFPNLQDIKEQISLTRDLKVLVIVHIGGYISPDIYQIKDYCEERGIIFIEDAAHAHGSEFNHHFAGTFGHASAFSFVQSKVITTGEGGMIVTNDEKIATLSRQYRNQGYGKDSIVHELYGNSWRMTEYAAAMGVVQLDRMMARRDHMQTIINKYSNYFSHNPQIKIVKDENNTIASGYKCIAVARSKQAKKRLVSSMRENGVQPARSVYEMPLHQQPLFVNSIQKGQQFPVADHFSSHHFCLPLWRTMSYDLAEEICRRIAMVIE